MAVVPPLPVSKLPDRCNSTTPFYCHRDVVGIVAPNFQWPLAPHPPRRSVCPSVRLPVLTAGADVVNAQMSFQRYVEELMVFVLPPSLSAVTICLSCARSIYH